MVFFAVTDSVNLTADASVRQTEGNLVTITFQFDGDSKLVTSSQWTKDGLPLDSRWTESKNGTSYSISTKSAVSEDSGVYTLLISTPSFSNARYQSANATTTLNIQGKKLLLNLTNGISDIETAFFVTQ